MTHLDALLALAAAAAGIACVVVAFRMTSGIGRIGLLLVLVLVALACLGAEPPSWRDITGYFALGPTIQKGDSR